MEMIVANTGSVSLSYDGDPRAAYRGLPHSDWIARILRSASPQMP